jgi:hypothetical protein
MCLLGIPFYVLWSLAELQCGWCSVMFCHNLFSNFLGKVRTDRSCKILRRTWYAHWTGLVATRIGLCLHLHHSHSFTYGVMLICHVMVLQLHLGGWPMTFPTVIWRRRTVKWLLRTVMWLLLVSKWLCFAAKLRMCCLDILHRHMISW